jgi:hypothetical protein
MSHMEIIQTFPNGTTIEFGTDACGHNVYRVCCSTGAMCRYVEASHCAVTYAQQYEEFYPLHPPKTGETHETQSENS